MLADQAATWRCLRYVTGTGRRMHGVPAHQAMMGNRGMFFSKEKAGTWPAGLVDTRRTGRLGYSALAVACASMAAWRSLARSTTARAAWMYSAFSPFNFLPPCLATTARA